LNPECGLEGFYCLPLLLRDVGPPIVVTTEHGLLQVAGAIFHCEPAALRKVAISVQ
jgi:hypothetical protein